MEYRPRELINAEQESKIINKLINIALIPITSKDWTSHEKNKEYTIQSFKPNSSQNTIFRGITTNKYLNISINDYHGYLSLGHQINKSSLQYNTCSQIIIGDNHEIRHDKFYDINKKTYTRDIQYMITRFKISSC